MRRRTIGIIQARMGSRRMPDKVVEPILEKPMIQLLLERLRESESLDEVVVATSTQIKDDGLANLVEDLGYRCSRGSETDVLSRYVSAALEFGADNVVRITGDCPLIDPNLVDVIVRAFLETSDIDYLSNIDPPTYPDGLDIEVFKTSALKKCVELTDKQYDREHVTPFLRESGLFRTKNIEFDRDLSELRWTVDDRRDFTVIKNVFEHFAPDVHFSWKSVLALQESKPELFELNKETRRNQGESMGEGQKLWQHAKEIIPGGNMLLSKRSEMFLPDYWPSYYERAKGCKVTDLDGRDFIDMSIMGIGTNTLGYAHPEVEDAVISAVKKGNMSTLNCREEVDLADKLVEMHPWSDMARFARTGGEANAIAIRIARAASGKDNVAICGYHGWHDWYLSVNLEDKDGLEGHLLSGLDPRGVPKSLAKTVYPFNYNDIKELERLIDEKHIGVIKMEVVRNVPPEEGFLERVRYLADKYGIVLIFDECTSGFRETAGGLHKKYEVNPDMLILGKALGNGHAITAVIGRREIMNEAQSTFISSTFWTERIGPAAALKTIEVMEREQSWEFITKAGIFIKEQWQQLADRYDLKIVQWGIPALAGFTIDSSLSLEYKTLITQEMLAKGYLAANSVYVCTEHSEDEIKSYIEALDPIFGLIQQCEEGRDVFDLLTGPVCHDGFKRIN